MKLKVLLLEPEIDLLDELASGLVDASRSFARDTIEFEVLAVNQGSDAIEHISSDGEIQAVVISTNLAADSETAIAKLLENLQNIRPEVPYYILGDEDEALKAINSSLDVESFFIRQDIVDDPSFVLGYIFNDFDDRLQTPFWTAYKKYVVESNDSWHTPGHSGGASFRSSPFIKDFYEFYGRNLFASDLSVSVDFLGSLSDSTYVIGKSQEAAAYTFEVDRTFYITNGSSTSNKIVIQSVLREGDKVIVDRNCHKSVHYGIIQARANPIYVSSYFSSELGIFAPPKLEEIKQQLKDNPDAKLIILTGCTYDGILLDLKSVVEMAHAQDTKVFIDEAWFGYGHFHPQFRPYSAIDCGADYITHSAHKVLSAFSQASFLHVCDPDFDEHYFREIYSLYTSTSPKYQLIASMDVCHKQLEMEGFKILNDLLTYVKELKDQVKSFNKIRILGKEELYEAFPHFENENVGHDPLKILIDISKLEYSQHDIHRFLVDEIGLEVEKYNQSIFLVLLTLGGTRSKMIRLYNALRKLDEGRAKLPKIKKTKQYVSIPPIELACLPSKAFFGEREAVTVKNSIGRIAAGLVSPYPPGIPVLVPGQYIAQEQADFILEQIAAQVNVQGVFEGKIYVAKD